MSWLKSIFGSKDKGATDDKEWFVPENEEVSPKMDKNVELVNQVFRDCGDFSVREVTIGPHNVRGKLVFFKQLADKEFLREYVLRVLPRYQGKRDVLAIADSIPCDDVKTERSLKIIIQEILDGDAALFIEGFSEAIIMDAKKYPGRGIEEPENETLARGPRDGFSENIAENIALVRRRLRDPHLKTIFLTMGERSRLPLCILYLEGVVDPEIVVEVEKRLTAVKFDAVFDTGYIEELLSENVMSPFIQMAITERPDRVAANLLEGRVAIILDGTPMVGMVPVSFGMLLQSPEDYYERTPFGVAVRLLRIFALLFGTTFPAVYIAFITFHIELIPSRLVISLAEGRVVLPFPAIIEALIMEISLEMLREASLRLPGSIGQTIGVVGALILGDAAIRANLASPAMVIVVALTAISAYIMPQFSTSYALRLIRFPMMILAAIFGAYGITLAWVAVVVHITALESLGQPYFAPIAPFIWGDMKDSILRAPLTKMHKRPQVPATLDQVRRHKNSPKGD